MGEVLPLDAADLEARGGFRVYPIPIPGQPMQFFLNTAAAPTDDPLVRKAILLASDRESIARIVYGGYSPVATGPLTAATWSAAEVVPFDLFDLPAAEVLLEQAGWTDSDGNGVREQNGTPLTLRIVIPPWGLIPQAAVLMEQQYRAAGFAVELVQVPSFSALVEAQKGGAYNLIAMNLAGTDPDLLRPFFRSDGLYNWAGYQDTGLDALVDDAVRSDLPAERIDLYRRIQEQIAGEDLLLPVRDYVNLNVATNRVEGLHYSAQGWFPVLIDVSVEGE
jgi:peptide/nickel transport system substrate-binding protein